MKYGPLIILFSWYLNAIIDAIDHGKGERTLYELWHILKAISYGLPFIYIVVIEKWPSWLIGIVAVLLCGWEIIYSTCRRFNLQEWDDKIKIPFLAWLWGIKR